MSPAPSLVVVALSLSGAWNLLGLASVISARRRRPSERQPATASRAIASAPRGPGGTPTLREGRSAGFLPVSIVKPLAGADDGLERCLESLFTQDHPRFEVIFGVERGDDPAIPIAERVRARYPDVPSRVVVHGRVRGLNPKVRNLLGTLPHASFDLVLASDSNVLAPPGHLTDLLATRARTGAGLVTSLVAGVDDRTLGGSLECVQLNGFAAAGSCLPTRLGDALVIGKTMLFAQAELRALGGLERVADLLAEDFVLGKTFQHAGFPVAIGRLPVANPTGGATLARFVERQTRWAVLRWRLRPVAFVLEPLTSPLVPLALAVAVLGGAALPWLLGWALLCWAARDVGGWIALRGARGAWRAWVLGPVRDLVMLVAWARAPFVREVTWRTHRLRLGAGTLLYATPGVVSGPRAEGVGCSA
ncbi:MAG: glycosyltransferase [Polyangiaceae bacterium]|nr:glycosyltransferase [Polyangiaceae bacterium]